MSASLLDDFYHEKTFKPDFTNNPLLADDSDSDEESSQTQTNNDKDTEQNTPDSNFSGYNYVGKETFCENLFIG